MAFRARVNPSTLARRAAAAVNRRPMVLPRAALSAPETAMAGPGPATLALYHSSAAARGISDLFSFGRGGAAPAPASTEGDKVVAAARSGYTRDVVSAYANAREAARRSGNGAAAALTPDQAGDVLEALRDNWTSGVPLRLARAVFADVPGPERTERHYRAMVGVLRLDPSTLPEAVRLAERHAPSLVRADWYHLIKAAERAGPAAAELLDTVLAAAPAHEEMYVPLLTGLLERGSPATLDDIDAVLARMAAREVSPGKWCHPALAELYADAGDGERARAIVGAWAKLPPVADRRLRTTRRHAAVYVGVALDDPAAVTAALRDATADPNEHPPIAGLTYLVKRDLPPTPRADDVLRAALRVSDHVGYPLPPLAWDKVVVNLLETPGADLKTAWDVYVSARSQLGPGAIPSAALADAFVARLCAPSPPLFAEAMEVYGDLTTVREAKGYMPKVNLFTSLLRAALRVPDSREAVAQLTGDLFTRYTALRLDARDATKFMHKSLDRAVDHPDAFALYDALHAVSEPLSASQYESVILRFISLSFRDSAVAAPELLLRMLSDMRNAGHRPGPKILTGLLTSYADLLKAVQRREAGADKAAVTGALLAAARDIQSLISLDGSIDVDVPLLCALMDAFSSAGAYGEAFDVWDEIVAHRPNVPAHDRQRQYARAVSVVLDTCGHAENPRRARKAWAWCRRHGLAERPREWAAWIEYLARSGRTDEAVATLQDMLANPDGPQPTPQMAAIPIKFARGRRGEVRRVTDVLVQSFPRWADDLERIGKE